MGTSCVHAGYIRTPDLRRLAIQTGFRLHVLAQQAGMCSRTLRRRIVRQFQLTPERWLMRLRMELAPRYLRRWKKAEAVLRLLGYKQLSHFCRHFKQFHGLTIGQVVGARTPETTPRRRLTTPAPTAHCPA